MAKYASGNQERLRLGFTNNNENDTSLRVVGRVGIGTTIFDASSSLDVRGAANISGTLTASNVNASSGEVNLSQLSVSGVSTFNGRIDVNDNLNVAGISTFNGNVGIKTNLDVAGISTFNGESFFNDSVYFRDGDVHFYGQISGEDISWDTSDGSLIANDNASFAVGTGKDLVIYHNGTNSYIDNQSQNAGNLYIRNSELNDNSDIYIQANDLKDSIIVNYDGSVELYYDGSKKLETNTNGISVSNGTSDTATIVGPENLIIDPAAVGDNTGTVRIKGDLFVDGTQTIINSSTIELADFVVGIATTATSDLLTDGAGIEIGPDNTFKYYYNGGTNPSLKSSENLNVASGKAYQIDQTEVLNATTLGSGVVNSSLTSVGNLTSLTVDGRIVGAATSNVIPFLYAGLSDLPDASTYHGAFAHVHATGAAYYAHGGNWLELVNKDTNGNVGLSGDLDVDGHTELDNLNVSGVSTFVGTANFNGAIDANGDLDVDGHTELDNLNVSGVSTFTGVIDSTGGLDVTGHTELDDLNVSGVSTFVGNIDANGDLDVDGHTELDDLNVSGVSTFQGDIFLPNDDKKINVGNNNALQIYRDGTLNTSIIENSVGHLIVRNTSANTSSDVYIQSDNEVRISNIGANQTFAAFYNGAQVELYHNNLKKFQTTSDGVTITGTTLTNKLDVSGISTFTGAIDANGGLDVDGQTELDDLNVTGVSTFTGTINANADLDVDGHTELDDLNVSGVSTFVGTANFSGAIDSTGGLDVTGHTELDDLNVSGVSTFTGAIDSNGGLDVTGHTELDTLNVSGISTFEDGLEIGGPFSGTDGVVIKAPGSGSRQILKLFGGGATNGKVVIQGHGPNNNNLVANAGGATELWWAGNNSKKLETTGIGVSIYDDLNVGTGVTIYGNSGIVSATAFYGDGSNLLNTGATLSAAAGTQRLVLTSLTSGTMVDAATDVDLTFNASTNTLDSANLNVSGHTGLNNLSVTGLSTFTGTAEFDANVRIDSTLSANGSVGNLGQYLQSTGIGVSWATFPTLRSTQTNTASAGQTTFNFSYNVNFLDVFVNGVKLTPSEYTATDGSQIILDTPAFAGEVIEFHSYNTTSYGGGGGGGGGGASNLNDLSDVSIGTLAANQLLQYNNATSQWVNVSATSVVNAASSFATKSATATTATAGQTTFNGTYTVGFVDVYLNGVKLSEDQYTATTGTNIVLDEGASENDIVEVVGLTANVPGSGGGSSYANSNVDTHLNTSTASTGEVLSWNGSDYDWVAQSSGGGGGASRNSETLTIGSIASGVTTTGTITLPKSGVMISIHPVGDASGWLRLYTRSDLADADAGRARTQDPDSGSGVILETITSGISTVYLSPQTIFANAEDTPINTFNYRFTKDGSAGITTFTFKYLSLES